MAEKTISNAEARAKITELVKDARICMLTTMTEDGRHVSRPMGLQEADFDGDLWFFAYSDSAKARQIHVHPQVNVSFSNQKSNAWVSIAGTATEENDLDKAKDLWNPILKAWFPDGLETPGLTLIKVHAESAEYWDAPNSKVLHLIGYAKAAVTGQPPDAGENREVRYPG
jgi:general stress protein 26